MKKITLNIGERIAALKIFDAFKGNISTLATILDDVKQFTVTDEEWTNANLTKTATEKGTEVWRWNEGIQKELNLQRSTVEYLQSQIDAKSKANEITLADTNLVTLDSKLK
jgi:hypothetical protein